MRRALAFLTPLGGASTPSPGALSWFPLVGALIGVAVGGVWWLAAKGWGPAPAAALAVAADLALTGLLHVDGLADSADGLLPHLDRQRRLEVMAEPGIGAFGLESIPPNELAHAFREMREPLTRCRFSDCTHVMEPGCAVRAAVDAGEVAPSRYASYVRIAEGALSQSR